MAQNTDYLFGIRDFLSFEQGHKNTKKSLNSSTMKILCLTPSHTFKVIAEPFNMKHDALILHMILQHIKYLEAFEKKGNIPGLSCTHIVILSLMYLQWVQ